MEIIETSREMSKRELFDMTMSDDTTSLKTLDTDTEIAVTLWVRYTTPDMKTGELKEILTFTDGITVFGTNSSTFQNKFAEIVDLMDGEPFSVVIKRGVSKNDREFITCSLGGC